MERLEMSEVSAVSKYWTPQHLDVTDVPLTYARPKATWIEGFERLRPLVKIDTHDRMRRHRVQTHAVVDPAEITVLPPLVAPQPAARAPQRESGFLSGVAMLRRRLEHQTQ
jgi:hypothetical protein